MTYVVVACPRCRRARVAEADHKTAACSSCDRPLVLADLRAQHRTSSLEDARHAAGYLNAKLAGRDAEFLAAHLPAPTPAPRHDDRFAAAAAAARKGTGETGRADAVVRALGEFDDDDLARAFETAGLRDPERHLRRMLETQVVHEPRAGRYRALG